MSKFLDGLKEDIGYCRIGDLDGYLPIHLVDAHQKQIDNIEDKIDSLGENARRMLDIGMVQDELIRLNFKPVNFYMYQYDDVLKNGKWMWLDFRTGCLYHNGENIPFDLSEPQTMLTKVKELINA